jgi:phage-related protein
MDKVDLPEVKPLEWVGNSRRIVRGFPSEVKQTVGQALFAAQVGDKHDDAKPMKGFKGAGVVEIVEDHDGDTYRAVYTVKLKAVVYALHAFKKKSKKGIKTPKPELDIIKQRLKSAQEHHKEHYGGG